LAILKGKRLDEVANASIQGITLKPDALSRVADFDQLAMKIEGSTTGLDPQKSYVAEVQLQDGRRLKVPVAVTPPRPQITLLNKGVQQDTSAAPPPVQLGSDNDLPVNGRLVFFLKSRVPANFPRKEKVEVAAVDGSFQTVLSLADTSLMLEDAKTAIATVDPLKSFGASAFGPIQVRAVSADGVSGDWIPLGTLVRLPGFKDLRCPRSLSKPCTLSGTNLFLASSIGNASDMDNATDVPPDFTGTQLNVAHPVNGTLYLSLRDDPDTVQTLTLAVTPLNQPQAQSAAQPTAAKVPAEAPPPAATPTAPAAMTAPDAPEPAVPDTTAPANPSTTTPPAQTTPAPAPAPGTTDPKTVPNPGAPNGN
jgi:hypothetical protein